MDSGPRSLRSLDRNDAENYNPAPNFAITTMMATCMAPWMAMMRT
jgi:hypothetical protein